MTMEQRTIIIGTRGSALAMWQANEVAHGLGCSSEIKIIKTSGDQILDTPLQQRLEKGFFTKEIEDRLLAGEIDLAVHSLKDLPTESQSHFTLGAFLPRAAVSDLLLVQPDSFDGSFIIPLNAGAVVGAGSLRRQALLRQFAPHVKPTLLRGNVPTRIRKCLEGQYQAIVIARAGVERLQADFRPLLCFELQPRLWLPAPGQGVVVVQHRTGDEYVAKMTVPLHDEISKTAVSIERALLGNFEGGCHSAFGALAEATSGEWMVRIGLEAPDGSWCSSLITGASSYCSSFSRHKPPSFKLTKQPLTRDELCVALSFPF